MKKYKNLSGKATVTFFEIAKDAVKVRFADNSVYLYSNQATGSANISKMKTLAEAGKGLSTFIDASVKGKFARKVR